MTLFSRLIRTALAFPLLLALAGCSDTLSRLEQVGKQPPMEQLQPPMQRPDYKPVAWPKNEPAIPQKRNANSLWQPGARAFFRDQRARRVGDIVKVIVKIQDKADLDNTSQRTRNGSESLGVPNLFGVQNKIAAFLPGKADPANLIGLNNAMDNKGSGTIARKEQIETQVAAMVTQILPNGNLVIDGKQEIRVNYELREVTVSGIVRPEDISAENALNADQIAEARISYGGRGHISDVQQPRIGSQVLDILSPF